MLAGQRCPRRQSSLSVSPEQDFKLFQGKVHREYNGDYDKYYRQWRQIDSPTIDRNPSNGLLPEHLSSEERKVAMEEHRAVPGVFYTRAGLPVITPSNYKHVITKVSVPLSGILLWSWFSGSAKLSYVATCLPFLACVWFPVDLNVVFLVCFFLSWLSSQQGTFR